MNIGYIVIDCKWAEENDLSEEPFIYLRRRYREAESITCVIVFKACISTMCTLLKKSELTAVTHWNIIVAGNGICGFEGLFCSSSRKKLKSGANKKIYSMQDVAAVIKAAVLNIGEKFGVEFLSLSTNILLELHASYGAFSLYREGIFDINEREYPEIVRDSKSLLSDLHNHKSNLTLLVNAVIKEECLNNFIIRAPLTAIKYDKNGVLLSQTLASWERKETKERRVYDQGQYIEYSVKNWKIKNHSTNVTPPAPQQLLVCKALGRAVRNQIRFSPNIPKFTYNKDIFVSWLVTLKDDIRDCSYDLNNKMLGNKFNERISKKTLLNHMGQCGELGKTLLTFLKIFPNSLRDCFFTRFVFSKTGHSFTVMHNVKNIESQYYRDDLTAFCSAFPDKDAVVLDLWLWYVYYLKDHTAWKNRIEEFELEQEYAGYITVMETITPGCGLLGESKSGNNVEREKKYKENFYPMQRDFQRFYAEEKFLDDSRAYQPKFSHIQRDNYDPLNYLTDYSSEN